MWTKVSNQYFHKMPTEKIKKATVGLLAIDNLDFAVS